MRIVATALIALTIAAPALTAQGSANEPELAFTPSGYGDPDAMVCRAPQKLPDGSPGPRVCMHNRVWALLTNTGKDLSADGHTVILRPMVDEPNGKGTPEAVTCRAPQPISSSRLRKGSTICMTNATWADLIARHYAITAMGKVVDMNNRGPANGPDNFPVATGSYGPE